MQIPSILLFVPSVSSTLKHQQKPGRCLSEKETLTRVCVSQFFQKRGVSEAMSVYDLFNAVTGLNIPVGAEDEAEFVAEVTNVFLFSVTSC